MGTAMFPDRTGLRPVYRWIFGRLNAAGCRWIYSFPRLYLVDLGGQANEDRDPYDYDPSEAVRREMESAWRAEEIDDLSERFDQWHEDGASTVEFDAWFKERVEALSGVDPQTDPLGPPTDCIFDSRSLKAS